jgi:putative colanic acid biosynthesis UDP-glucose lipid carrier transferase
VAQTVSRFFSREYAGLIELATRWLDLFGGVVSALLALALSQADLHGEAARDWVLLVLIHLLLSLFTFQQGELYRSWRGRPYSDQFARLMLAWAVASVLTVSAWFGVGLQPLIDLGLLMLWLGLQLVVVGGQRAALHLSMRHLRRLGGNPKRVIIYGAGPLGLSIRSQTVASPESGFQVIGFLDDGVIFEDEVAGVPLLGGRHNIEEVLVEHNPDELWIALPLSALERLASTLDLADERRVSVRLFPDIYGMTLLNHSASELLGFPILDLNVDRMQGVNRWVKNTEDRVLGFVFLLIALPVIALIALVVKLESRGPVLFKQKRNGFDGKPFTIYKFRTMQVHREPEGQLTQARKHDERFTRIGRFLRRSSLDELPQLVNVLQGRMSLVGPRPHAIEHNEYFSEHIEGYLRRHRVKPGITGWAQVNDLRGETQTIEEMSRRVKHDLYYIEHWSLWFDLRIILTTILKMFFSRKAW